MKPILLTILGSFCAVSSFSQCNSIDISVEENSVCAPKIVRFNIINAPSDATFTWDIGQGSTAGADTIYGYYNESEIVNATVEVKLADGEVCFISKDSALIINKQPEPVFLISRDKLCNGPDTVYLKDCTPNVMVRNWVVDGTSYNNASEKLIHSFVTTGKKNISLITTDSNGCQGIGSVKNAVEVFPNLKFDFKASITNGCIPLQTKFSITSNPKTPFKKTYSWQFDSADIEFSNVDTPSIVRYSKPGSQNVTFSVYTDNGCSYEVFKPNYIKVGDTLDLDLALEDTVYCLRDTIRLMQSNALEGGTTQWFLSGTADTLQDITNTSSIVVPEKTGLLTIKLVHNFNSCISQKTYKDTIEVRGIRAGFTSDDNYHCEVPHTVHLQNITDEFDAQSVNYTWLIKENGNIKYSSNQINDSFTFYTLPAKYDVQLIATGDNGCNDTFTRPNFIYQDSLKLEFEALPKIGCANQEIKFINRTKPSSYLSSDQFEWYFKDLDRITNRDSSLLRNPTTTYTDTGYYDVLLIGKNGINCRDTLRLDSIIRIVKPELKFEVDKDIICLGNKFKLSGLTTPVEAKFNHKWELIHLDSEKTIHYSGDNVNGIPTLAGEYRLLYSHDILGGCVAYDSIPLYVNGISASALVDTNSGCSPLEVNAQPQINYNFNFGQNSDSINFEWKVNPKTGSVLINAKQPNPKAVFNADGEYKLQVHLINAAGCSNNAFSEPIIVGVRADFAITKNVLCFGDSLRVKDHRSNNAEILDWEILKDVGSVENRLNDQDYSFSIPKEGNYSITQIVHRDMMCFDTLKKQFKVIEVKASFSSTDTFLMCAPVYTQFQSSSKNADSLFWDFGDGTQEVTKSNSAGHVYEKNSGWNKGFDIKLIAQSKYGCSDTAIKEDYLVVQGPVPFFIPTYTNGCEPLNVAFSNQSSDAVKSILNYNDGTTPDYSKEPNYTFKHAFRNSPDSTTSHFFVDLITYDSLGCAAAYSLPTPIRVKKSPKIQLQQSFTNKSCVPFDLTLADTSNTAIAWDWKVDTIATFSDSAINLDFTNYGEFPTQLVATNDSGCVDTLSFIISAKETPKVDFASDDTLCKNKLAFFRGMVASVNATDQVFWNFGEPSNFQNINDSDLNASITYHLRGPKNVQFKAVLQNGCADSISKTVNVTDEQDIDTSRIRYVSINDNAFLEIYYNENTYSKFNYYKIRKSGSAWKNVYDEKTTLVLDDFTVLPFDSFCYDLSIQDYCDFSGEKSKQHCFIDLSISSNNNYENTLSWTPYVGWPFVKDYTIFRSTNTVDFEAIGKVAGTILTYLDSNLCDVDYTYYVQASHPIDSFKSNSTRVTIRPKYFYNPYSSSIKNVSVIGQNQIEVLWNKSSHPQTEKYVLQKFNPEDFALQEEVELSDTGYIDENVQTDIKSYLYVVTEKDKCGYINIADRYGKSILLKGYYANESSTINESRMWWNRYEQWENGVSNYNILLFDVPLPRIIGKTILDTTFVDPEYHEKIKEYYCYQVFATNEIQDTSYSNVLCVNGKARIEVPSAFTPNKDGLNDQFKPITQFVQQSDFSGIEDYEFTIYNRWGEKLFETNDLNKGWNGYYKEAVCQSDVYMYIIRVKSLDNQVTNYSGFVSLLR